MESFKVKKGTPVLLRGCRGQYRQPMPGNKTKQRDQSRQFEYRTPVDW